MKYCIHRYFLHQMHTGSDRPLNILPSYWKILLCFGSVACLVSQLSFGVDKSQHAFLKSLELENILIHIHLFQILIRYLKSPCSCCSPSKNWNSPDICLFLPLNICGSTQVLTIQWRWMSTSSDCPDFRASSTGVFRKHLLNQASLEGWHAGLSALQLELNELELLLGSRIFFAHFGSDLESKSYNHRIAWVGRDF